MHDQCSRSHLPGVVAKWNAEHPDDAIRVGDRSVKIGGDESLQGFALIEKLKEDGKFVACVMKCTKSMKNCESMPRSQGFPLWLLASGDMQLSISCDICRRLEAEVVDFTILRYSAVWRLNGQPGLCLGWTPASWNLQQEMAKHVGYIWLKPYPSYVSHLQLMSYTRLYWFGCYGQC